MESKFDVFLSYSHLDSDFAAKLKIALCEKDVSVWLDKDQIRPGDWFAEALEKGVRSSNTVAFLISKRAISSNWVKEEYYRALSLCNTNGVRLIPVLLEDADVPDFLSSRQYVDFRPPKEFQGSVDDLFWGISGQKPQHTASSESDAVINQNAGSLSVTKRLRPGFWMVAGPILIATGVKLFFDNLPATKDAPLDYREVFLVFLVGTILFGCYRLGSRKLKDRLRRRGSG